ncbi:MAG: hypothetical protein ABSH16_03275 [Sedimentisphaerales bacterium]
MSFPDAYMTGQQTGGHHPRLADLLRIRQMERLLKHTLGELEKVKARLNQLEKATAIQSPDAAGTVKAVNTQHSEATTPMPPLPIAEIKQLAEMAKRFR